MSNLLTRWRTILPWSIIALFLLCPWLVIGAVLFSDPPRSEARAHPSFEVKLYDRRESPPASDIASSWITVEATFQTYQAPCVQLPGGAIGMPLGDRFDVVRILDGEIKQNMVCVRPFTERGPKYPTKLDRGTVYKLRMRVPRDNNDSQTLYLDAIHVELVD